MSGVHKYLTISFRVSPREHAEIEAKIIASGLLKKDYFIRSCIYNRVCVVGKKEVVYQLVKELKVMQINIKEITEQFEQAEVTLSPEGLEDMKYDCLSMLKAILWMLDGANYLWEKEPTNENAPADWQGHLMETKAKPLSGISRKYSIAKALLKNNGNSILSGG